MATGDTKLVVVTAGFGSADVVLVKGKDYTPRKNDISVYLNLGLRPPPAIAAEILLHSQKIGA